MLSFRHRLRLAGRLQVAWQAGSHHDADLAVHCDRLRNEDFASLFRLSEHARRVTRAGWAAAAADLAETLRFRLASLRGRLDEQLQPGA